MHLNKKTNKKLHDDKVTTHLPIAIPRRRRPSRATNACEEEDEPPCPTKKREKNPIKEEGEQPHTNKREREKKPYTEKEEHAKAQKKKEMRSTLTKRIRSYRRKGRQKESRIHPIINRSSSPSKTNRRSTSYTTPMDGCTATPTRRHTNHIRPSNISQALARNTKSTATTPPSTTTRSSTPSRHEKTGRKKTKREEKGRNSKNKKIKPTQTTKTNHVSVNRPNNTTKRIVNKRTCNNHYLRQKQKETRRTDSRRRAHWHE
jgi:hypothetical protein